MKLPRDVGGEELAGLLRQYGYQQTRQTGSHMRLTSSLKGAELHLTIPRHDSLRIGTLDHILKDLTAYLKMDRQALIKALFKGK
jgi:predicted RNA binding protein YcfA (HicA-like mRNA interferase family)